MRRPEELAAISMFDGLSEAQLRAVAAVLRPRAFKAGETILREGETSDCLFCLLDGTVHTTKRLGIPGADGEREVEKTLVRLSAPQFFGEIGLLGEGERSATVRAETDCAVEELARREFDRLVEADLALGYAIVRNVALVMVGRLHRTDRDVLKLTAALSLALGNR